MEQLSEFTFTVYTTHRILDDLRPSGFTEPYVVAPTQYDESFLGYDAAVKTVKTLLLQYKRARGHKRLWTFPLEIRQTLNLCFTAGGPNRAFFVLPRIFNERDLAQSLPPPKDTYFDRVVFVDPVTIPLGTRMISWSSKKGWQSHSARGPLAVQPTTWSNLQGKIAGCTAGILTLERSDNGVLVLSGEGRKLARRREQSESMARRYREAASAADRGFVPEVLTEMAGELWDAIRGFRVDSTEEDGEALVLIRDTLLEELRIRRTIDFKIWGMAHSEFVILPRT